MINIMPMHLSNLPKQMLNATLYCSWLLHFVYFDLKLLFNTRWFYKKLHLNNDLKKSMKAFQYYKESPP